LRVVGLRKVAGEHGPDPLSEVERKGGHDEPEGPAEMDVGCLVFGPVELEVGVFVLRNIAVALHPAAQRHGGHADGNGVGQVREALDRYVIHACSGSGGRLRIRRVKTRAEDRHSRGSLTTRGFEPNPAYLE